MKIQNDIIIMDDGTKYGIVKGIIGINSNLETFEGEEGSFPWAGPLSPVHKMELAQYMMDTWHQYWKKASEENQ